MERTHRRSVHFGQSETTIEGQSWLSLEQEGSQGVSVEWVLMWGYVVRDEEAD